ncbi:cyclic nucleotide-binding domain-containing protein [Sinorhizobium meliloti]|uniref:cyclic nucleotide-binding domain-containing protein n=1 Tax=Rhizobium meliloti TaxID=382 RepID=UPI00299E5961|nr:cyclic nucleotide-binding domain-containing protein [Sinorhizobium meliloti]
MYAAAQAKPQSIEAEHLGPAPISRSLLSALSSQGREIYAQGDLNDRCYQVSTGAVRVYRLLSDGRRQVVSFHLPGEMFGFEAGSNHSFFAEAITETTLAVFGRRHIQERSRELLALALTGMARAQQHLLVIGRQCAVARNEQVVRSTIWSISRPNYLKKALSFILVTPGTTFARSPSGARLLCAFICPEQPN